MYERERMTPHMHIIECTSVRWWTQERVCVLQELCATTSVKLPCTYGIGSMREKARGRAGERYKRSERAHTDTRARARARARDDPPGETISADRARGKRGRV